MGLPIATAVDIFTQRRVRGARSLATLRTMATAWRQKHVDAGNLEYAAALSTDATPIAAYINHGRWVIDCACGAGAVAFSPAARTGTVCFSCGTVWTTVHYPAEWDAVEGVLRQRRYRKNQNWYVGETVANLQAENVARGDR